MCVKGIDIDAASTFIMYCKGGSKTDQGVMMMEEKYTAGELAKLAGVSSRTVRYYDKKGLLKPVSYTESGYRLYDSHSALQLQKIKLLQYAGLSLKQIDRMMESQSGGSVTEVLWGQKLLLEQKRNQLNQVLSSLEDALFACGEAGSEHERMESVLDILHVTDMETPFDFRYDFYETYSQNQQGWFQWVYDQLQVFSGAEILDMGCGHGNLWIRNWTRIPEGTTVTVVEKRNSAIDFLEQFYQENKKFLQKDVKFIFLRQDLERDFVCARGGEIKKYDRIAANHLWDFIADKDALMEKAKNMLDGNGFMLSTYSSYGFLEEINRLLESVSADIDFPEQIACHERRREQLEEKLRLHFPEVRKEIFQNHLTGITDARALAGYIESHYPKEYPAVIQKIHHRIQEQGALEILTYAPLYKCYMNGSGQNT